MSPVTGQDTPHPLLRDEPLVLADLTRVRRTETEVYRGNERRPMLSINPPALGLFNARGTRRLQQVCQFRALGTNRPNRLDAHFSDSTLLLVCIPGVVPESDLDDGQDDEDLFEVKWIEQNGRATVNLIELLQPRNLTVPQGKVMEVPVALRTVAGKGVCLLVDFSDPYLRDKRSGEADEQAAAALPEG